MLFSSYTTYNFLKHKSVKHMVKILEATKRIFTINQYLENYINIQIPLPIAQVTTLNIKH